MYTHSKFLSHSFLTVSNSFILGNEAESQIVVGLHLKINVLTNSDVNVIFVKFYFSQVTEDAVTMNVKKMMRRMQIQSCLY